MQFCRKTLRQILSHTRKNPSRKAWIFLLARLRASLRATQAPVPASQPLQSYSRLSRNYKLLLKHLVSVKYIDDLSIILV